MHSCQKLESQLRGHSESSIGDGLRGEEHQACKVFAIAFNYNGGCVHIFPEERPTQRFLIFCSHISWRETSCQKKHKESF